MLKIGLGKHTFFLQFIEYSKTIWTFNKLTRYTFCELFAADINDIIECTVTKNVSKPAGYL